MANTTGTLAETGSVTLTKPPSHTSTLVVLSGTYGTVTLVFEGSYDSTNFFPLAAVSKKLGTAVTGTVSPTDNEEIAWVVPSEFCSKVRARVTAIASGTAEFALASGSFVGALGALTVATSGTSAGFSSSGDVLLADSVKMKFGDSSDITMAWDGTDFDVLQAAANSSIKWGVDAAGIDQVWYGDSASTHMTWDQSVDSLIFTGAARVVFTGTTGQSEIHLTDNLADALSVEISGSTDLLTFTTTDNAECVSPIGLRTRQSTAVAITGATTLKLSDSGGVFTVAQSSTYDIDLPSPTSGPGCRYFFHLTSPGAFSPTITVAGAAATFVGTITIDATTIPATGATLTFATGAAALGDWIEIQSLTTGLYHVRAIAQATGGITIT